MKKSDKQLLENNGIKLNDLAKIISNNVNTVNTDNNLVDFFKGKHVPNLTLCEIRKILSQDIKYIPIKFLKIVHFNPKYAEYQNIGGADDANEHISVYYDGKWNWVEINELVNILYNRCKDYVRKIIDLPGIFGEV